MNIVLACHCPTQYDLLPNEPYDPLYVLHEGEWKDFNPETAKEVGIKRLFYVDPKCDTEGLLWDGVPEESIDAVYMFNCPTWDIPSKTNYTAFARELDITTVDAIEKLKKLKPELMKDIVKVLDTNGKIIYCDLQWAIKNEIEITQERLLLSLQEIFPTYRFTIEVVERKNKDTASVPIILKKYNLDKYWCYYIIHVTKPASGGRRSPTSKSKRRTTKNKRKSKSKSKSRTTSS